MDGQKAVIDDKTLKLLAFREEPMPDGLSQSNQLLFLGLRELYHQNANGELDENQGLVEQERLFKQRDRAKATEEYNARYAAHLATLYRDLETSVTGYLKARRSGETDLAIQCADVAV